MQAVFLLMFFQVLLGAFDNFWHHELAARLPQRGSARRELALHAAREAIYGGLFLGFAWLQWLGAWVLLPAVALAVEIVITCADFLEEDRSRRLPPLERVLHTVLAVSYGVLLGLLAPIFLQWSLQPTALQPVHHGLASWFFTLAAAGVLGWSVRNALAARRLRATHIGSTTTSHARRSALLVTGATGFIGGALVNRWLGEGQRVIVLTRDTLQARRMFGPAAWVVDRLDDIPSETRIDAVVHLAGATVLGMPWTARRREQLVTSRAGGTQQLLALMARLEQRPRVLVSASAVGFYGVSDRRRPVTEDAPPQPGRFQSDLCVLIEREAQRAAALGIRVVCLRFGIVLGKGGGAYPALALAARLGLGARLGAGVQPVPWIHLDDAVGLVRFAVESDRLAGPLNAVAPEVAPQSAFATAMAASFGRRVLLRAPAWPLRLTLGEMSELLLCGQWAVPRAACAAGYRFRYGRLEAAMQSLAGRRGEAPPSGSCDAPPALLASDAWPTPNRATTPSTTSAPS